MKNKKDYFQWLLFKQFLSFSIHLPYFFYKSIISFLSPFLLFSFRKFYRIALLNIVMCFKKTISLKQKKQLISQATKFYFLSLLHLYLILINKKKSKNPNILYDKQLLEKNIKKSTPAIIATAHFGLFPLIALILSRENYIVDVVIKPPHNYYFKNFVFSYMEKNKIGIIPTSPELNCFKAINNSIKNNHLIMLMIDQTPLPNQANRIVKFFDWDTLVYPTIPELAKKHNLPIFPIFSYYESNDLKFNHIIKIYDAIDFHNEEEVILECLNKILEELILKYPWQWWWFHKRWRNLLDYDNPYFYKFAKQETNNFFYYLNQKSNDIY